MRGVGRFGSGAELGVVCGVEVGWNMGSSGRVWWSNGSGAEWVGMEFHVNGLHKLWEER